MQLWNETVLLQTLEKATANDPNRTPNEQKIGDYYYSCMDTKTIEAHTQEWLKPELDLIAAIKNKKEIAKVVAHLHQTIPGANQQGDNASNAAILGFAGQTDYDDASRNVAQIDQGGMAHKCGLTLTPANSPNRTRMGRAATNVESHQCPKGS